MRKSIRHIFLATGLAGFILITCSCSLSAQSNKVYTLADTLRGTIGPGRIWWNVLRYDLSIEPDFLSKTTRGSNLVTYSVLEAQASPVMQIDLKSPLRIDSVLDEKGKQISFSKGVTGTVWYLKLTRQPKKATRSVRIFFSGKPTEAVRAPWEGGWTFGKDSLGRPWMTVTCQGAAGASVWYPCKDHQSDEPDNGASLSMRVPDSLVAVANGRLTGKKINGDGTTTYTWSVVNPINNYNLIPYIGKYTHFHETYSGEKGNLDLDYWVLDYNEQRARAYLPKEVHNMLKGLEYWFGPYPFYEDGYKLVDVAHTGMEHQSAVAYGNQYQGGYRKRDGSGTGWGLKWDFIVVHESGHEWFGNNITSNDLADMWVHEGFTNYSETLYVDYIFGSKAANEYNAGIRRGIRNDRPIIPVYGVNAQGSGDMYPKASNMLHAIRHSIYNDSLFRNIMRGLNKSFYHQTVNSTEIEKYISQKAGFDYGKVFDQYLRNTAIPRLEYTIKDRQIRFRYSNCIPGFNLPLVLADGTTCLKLAATDEWQTLSLTAEQAALITVQAIKAMYYIEPIDIK